MPYYLWIDDHFSDEIQMWDTGEARPARRFHCEACDMDRVEERKGSRWKTTYRQNEKASCPMCGAAVTVKHMGRGFSGLRHQLDAVIYGPSMTDPAGIVAYAAHLERDYGNADIRAPWELETEVQIRGIAVLIYGKGAWRFDRKVAEWDSMVPGRYRWQEARTLNAMNFGSYSFNNRPERVVLTETLEWAIEGTPFERVWDDCYMLNYELQDGLRALSMIAKYPCIEYMTKLGWSDFLVDYLRGRLPSGIINWRGRDMAGVLRLKKSRLAELKGQRIGVTPQIVATLQWADANGIRCGARVALGVGRAIFPEGRHAKKRLREVVTLLPRGKWAQALKYIARQSDRAILSDFEDYWKAERALGADLALDAVAFPRDFGAAHDRATHRRKFLSAQEFDAAIKRRRKKLEKQYGFQFGGLILRPAASGAEVIREGETLQHCVGGYVKSYAEGRTSIFVLRRLVEPDRPWRTVEIANDGHVVQDRGYKNDWGPGNEMSDEYRAALDLFWEAWRERGA